jgi:DNA-binding NtrC family response regulator
MLEANGYEVLAVGGPDEAARLVSARCVDLLLTDVVMPEVSGSQLAARLSAVAPAMRILFMSGYSDEAVVRRGVVDPNASFLQKPFATADLARRVSLMLEQRSAA